MVSHQIKKSVFSLIVSIGLMLASTAAAHIRFPFARIADQKKPAKNLILVLDVKQQESYLGACGYSLEVALQDEVAPIIASKHALSFVQSYIKPERWDIYEQDNLLLFMPKAYLETHKFSEPVDAGFNIDGWHKLSYAPMRGSALYTTLGGNTLDNTLLSVMKTFDDLSSKSTKIIVNTLSKNKYCRWKVYAVGHGAPDARQVCGLNLKDFRAFLDVLEQGIETDFFIYETCFGGGPEQLKKVYADQQGIFKKFNFPIISCCLTNSVSFGFNPETGVTFKPLFTNVNASSIMNNKMRRLLEAINAINKGLDIAREYRWSNNLLLIRLPSSEMFEPVADNKSVFKLSEFSTINEESIEYCANEALFKCMLINKPILNTVLDLTQVKNFMIASGISRNTHYIKELRLAATKDVSTCPDDADVSICSLVALFNSLGMTEQDKIFFIDTVLEGTTVYSQVKIVQKADGYYSNWTRLNYTCNDNTHNTVADGYICFAGNQLVSSEQKTLNNKETQLYLDDYKKAVRNHLNRIHELPFGGIPLSIPFRILGAIADGLFNK